MSDAAPTVTSSRSAVVGELTLRRALPVRAHRTVGPWCFLDHFGPAAVSPTTTMTIGPHPHIGLQTVTWLIAGEALHTDSLGSEQLIRPGQLNLMTAGHGVAHAEDSRHVTGGTMHGVQLWVAQPEHTRHGPAAFEHHADLPVVALGPATATVLVGSAAGVTSPARTDSALVGADIEATRPGEVVLPLEPTFEHGIMVLAGAIEIGGVAVGTNDFAYLDVGRDDLRMAVGAGTRVLVLGGEPFEAEILMWWNFVARRRDEVDDAYRDWQAGTGRFGTVATDLARIGAPRPSWSTDPS